LWGTCSVLYASCMSRIIKFVIILVLSVSPPLQARAGAETEKFLTLQGKNANVLYPPGLKADAGNVHNVLGSVASEVQAKLGLSLDYRPVVIIITDREAFRDSVGSKNISAYAVSEKGLIVMDYSLVLTKPFTLKSTLKHELVHLVLGRHLGRQIPKWLNEGVAQLIADSPAEIILSRNTSMLSGAVLSDRLIPLAGLKTSFPPARRGMVLAYEESLSFVRFLDKEFGRDGLLEILRAVKNGKSHTDAISSVTGAGIDELESKWKEQLRLKVTWLSYFSNHFYELLFALAALLTFFAFIRVIYRIRTYRDDE